MGDVEGGLPLPLTAECKSTVKKGCMLCGCLAIVVAVITFIVCMANYAYLGPDDQVKVRDGRGYVVYNGPWSGQLNPFREMEFRKATVLDPLQYAVIQHRITAERRHEIGPQLLFLKADDNLISVEAKWILERDQYIRLVDKSTGLERVLSGPQAIVPTPMEYSPHGMERGVYLTMDGAVIVLNKISGLQRLVTSCNHQSGVFVPDWSEEVLAQREIVHVLPHEAMVVRDVSGIMTIYSGRAANSSMQGQGSCVMGADASSAAGGTAFFLPPYDRIVRMHWSTYSSITAAREAAATTNVTPATGTDAGDPLAASTTARIGSSARALTPMYVDQAGMASHTGPKRTVVAIDLRVQKSFYSYQVRTNDNVKLRLEGTLFWEIEHVAAMVNRTSDPEGDVWHHSRSILVQVVSTKSLSQLMANFNTVMDEAATVYNNDAFYADRGINLASMELTKFEPVDQATATVLQDIIRETTRRINQLQKQRSDNDVRLEKMTADIAMETNRTILIETGAHNTRLTAEAKGGNQGSKIAGSIGAFLDNLGTSIPNAAMRMDLFKHHERLQSSKVDAEHLSGGNASLYIAPENMELRLQMPHSSPEL